MQPREISISWLSLSVCLFLCWCWPRGHCKMPSKLGRWTGILCNLKTWSASSLAMSEAMGNFSRTRKWAAVENLSMVDKMTVKLGRSPTIGHVSHYMSQGVRKRCESLSTEAKADLTPTEYCFYFWHRWHMPLHSPWHTSMVSKQK